MPNDFRIQIRQDDNYRVLTGAHVVSELPAKTPIAKPLVNEKDEISKPILKPVVANVS